MATRKPVRVLPDPVGAAIKVSPPAPISGQPPTWGAVGPSGKRLVNQEATAGWHPRSASGVSGRPAATVVTLLRVPVGCDRHVGESPCRRIGCTCNERGRSRRLTGPPRRKRRTMAELNQTLPLLPLTSGVALPGMVFTLALETEEALAAADAAGAAGGRLVLVAHVDGRYASIGVVAEIMEVG